MGLTIGMPISSFLPTQGGAEVGLHNIAVRLQALGHTPIVMTSNNHVRRLRKENWELPYQVLSFPPKIWTLLRLNPRMAFVLLDYYFWWIRHWYNIDVWHCTMGYPTGVALTHSATRFQNMPHLVRCAGEDIQRMPDIGYGARLDPKVDEFVRRWLPASDILIAISESVAAEYEQLGVTKENIAYIPNGVALERFACEIDRNMVRGQYSIAENDFVFVCVGRNHPKKDFLTLIKACRVLKDKGLANFKALIVGKGNSKFYDFVVELGLAKEITLLDEINSPSAHDNKFLLPPSALVEIYKMSDCFVFPSLIETFGIVLVEAMAAGLPIVTTNAPGCRDIVRNGCDGVIVEPENVRALADAMHQVATDQEYRQQLSVKARARAKDFSWDMVTERYTQVYDQLLEKYAKQKMVSQLGR